MTRHATLAVLFLAAVAFCLSDPAGAQETFRLTETGDLEKLESYPADSPQGKLQAIRKMLAEGRPDDAQDAADRWLEQYPNHAWAVEAYFLRGDAKAAQNRHYDALFDYEIVIKRYYDTEQFFVALERELEIARLFVRGYKRRFLGMPLLPSDIEGEELLIRIQERAPGSTAGEQASMELADYYFRDGQMVNAKDAYDLFLLNYPQSAMRERAMLRLIQANLALFKGPRFDPTGLIEAATRLRTFAEQYPAAAERIGARDLLARIDESLALKLLYSAQWYERRNESLSAVYTYRRVVTDHPTTEAARMAIARLDELGKPVIPVGAPTSDTQTPIESDSDATGTADPTRDLPGRSGYGDEPARPGVPIPETGQ